MWPSRTIILGGARSGKSRFAERMLKIREKPCIYLATASAGDDSMAKRIEDHKCRRPKSWRTIETPLEAAKEIRGLPPTDIALFECATLWLSNQILEERDIEAESDALIAAVQSCPAELVIVSNEVGHGVVPGNELARRFRDEQGRLNQRLAAECDLAVFIAAGLPLVLKGSLPKTLL